MPDRELTKEKLQQVAYTVIAEGKAKLRLYLNDPLILKQLTESKTAKEHGLLVEMPVPLIIEGKVVIGKTDDGKTHYFFTHDNPDFIPVFFDLENMKLHRR